MSFYSFFWRGAYAATLVMASLYVNGRPAKADEPVLLGATRCFGCHQQPSILQVDSDVTRFVELNEAIIWYENDPHAKAYRQLDSSLGQQISRRLGIDAQHDRQCLSCHSGWVTSQTEAPPDVHLGVSCEACHGPGSQYRPVHDTAQWRAVTPDQKQALGMTNVRDPQVKAELCISCHIGNSREGKVISHRMYAAGHPPLGPFEMGHFTKTMPRHWRALKNKAQFTHRETFERLNGYRPNEPEGARDAIVGSLIGLRTTISLLADAMETSDGQSQGPDVAIFDCAACHHELRVSHLQGQETLVPRSDLAPGRPPRPRWSQHQARISIALLGVPAEPLSEHLRPLDASIARQPFGQGQRTALAAAPVLQ